MDNRQMNNMNSMPPMNGMSGQQPVQPATPQGMPPIQSVQPGPMPSGQSAQPMPGAQPVPGAQMMSASAIGPNGMPMVQQVQVPTTPRKDYSGLIKTIVIVVLSLIAVTFIGLFIWMMTQYDEARSNVDGQIDVAVAKAKDEQATELEKEFQEREKYPYKTFAGPADYGELTFEYPKTWSVYVAEAATNGGNFNAYFNPIQVDTVSEDTINALRVSILNSSFEEVTADYQNDMNRKNSNLTVESVTIGKDKDITANRYTGTIPDTELSGFIIVFKIRDKTAILQTDSVFFQEDFDKLLGTVNFNK
jgi:uncharacterized protein YxeA